MGIKYLESVIISKVINWLGKWTTETTNVNVKIIRSSLEWSKRVGKGQVRSRVKTKRLKTYCYRKKRMRRRRFFFFLITYSIILDYVKVYQIKIIKN